MSFWLAEKREGQEFDHIRRFDPRFWTVNFPRPMVASVVATDVDALRVDATFLRKADLAGLIWDSTDRYDHPLLAYETARDYSRTTLSFRWRSGGIIPLDGTHGPTLTIEGRDADGNARTWYVRIWNYAVGTIEDAQITLPFSSLDGGFHLPDDADPVWPGDIDRMFISLVAPDYEPGLDEPLDSAVEAGLTLPVLNNLKYDAYAETDAKALIDTAGAYGLALNHVNRSIGHDDIYPFGHSQTVQDKLAAARRKVMVQKFARTAAMRLQGLRDRGVISGVITPESQDLLR